MLKRLLMISGVLILSLAVLMIGIALGQQRNFADEGSIVLELWAQELEVYSVKPASSVFGADLTYYFSSSQLDVMNPSFDGFDCAPDGKSLLVHHISLSRFDIPTQKLSIVPSSIGYTLGLAYSPDGQQIAYINIESGGIFLSNLDGSHVKQIIRSDYGTPTSLSWSPDGKRIVFSANTQVSGRYRFSIDAVDVASGRVETIDAGTDELDQVAWSPDGSRIAFAEVTANAIDLYTIQPNGSRITHLTHNQTKTINPRWSPDGSLISYSELDLSGHFQVYVMNADGSDPYLVYAPPRGEDAFDLCWLKD